MTLLLVKSGIRSEHKFKIEEEVITKLVNQYCREAGVRSLERYTKRMLEKIAFKIVESEGSENTEEVVVNKDNLTKYIGQPQFPAGRFYEQTPTVTCSTFSSYNYTGRSSWAGLHGVRRLLDLSRGHPELVCCKGRQGW